MTEEEFPKPPRVKMSAEKQNKIMKIGFLILIGITLILQFIVEKLFDETHINFPTILKILKSNK